MITIKILKNNIILDVPTKTRVDTYLKRQGKRIHLEILNHKKKHKAGKKLSRYYKNKFGAKK